MNFNKITASLIGLIGLASVSTANASDCGSYTSTLFGPQVCVFNDKMPLPSIQHIVNTVHNADGMDEMDDSGKSGYALLFQPGNYPSITIPVGFYTQVLGLGLTPDATTINAVQVTDKRNGTSLTNFWRSAENITTGPITWAVSQASPLRNMHVKGNVALTIGVYASGGVITNSTIDGTIQYGGQQQWFTRNTAMAGASGGVWNNVFVGDTHAPASGYPNTTITSTPQIQEKPYLVYEPSSQTYEVVVPTFNSKPSAGPDLTNTNTIIPQTELIVVQPSTLNIDDINSKLNNPQDKNPKALIFTPGRYLFNKTLNISQENTVVLGLGVPILTATTPHIPIISTAASGVKISGIIFEAGSNAPLNTSDPSLLEVGDGSHGSQTSPTLLADIYCRVGGHFVAQTNSCVTINDNYVIGDNLWLWRADHGAGAGSWTSDQSNNGLIVKGNNVTMYGLAVEHFQKEQVLWSGENGGTYFYQSELPYDVPVHSQISASFVVNSNVAQFNGYGLGIYNYFRSGPAYALSAIKAPNHSGISFTHMVNVTLTGPGTVQHMIQTTDGACTPQTCIGPGAPTQGPANWPAWQGTGQ